MRPGVAAAFQDRAFPGGLTYNSHPLACAAAIATLAVYEDEDLIERARRMGEVLQAAGRGTSRRGTRRSGPRGRLACSVSSSWCAAGTTYEPMAPYNGTSEEMTALGRFFREHGALHLRALQHLLHQPAARCVSEAQLDEGLAIIDRGLEITDRAVAGITP